jgi:uncharacterized protein
MKVALLTGPTSGIGFELAKNIARDNLGLILVGRNQTKLDDTKKKLAKIYDIFIETICVDLSEQLAAQEIMKQFTILQKKNKNSLQIQYLINNAGVGDFAEFAKSDSSKIHQLMMCNMVTLTELTREVLPLMKAQKFGRIMNVASTAAFLPGPLMAVYYASKAFVLSFTEALSEELRGSAVTITALCPGPTKSGFQKTANLSGSKLFKVSPIMTADEVAGVGYDGMKRKKRIVIPGFYNKITALTPRILPRGLVTRLVKRIQEK